jgi:hypothetical protein
MVSDGSVIGWVHGVPVTSAALDAYVVELAAGPVGTRLGITGEPEVRTDLGRSKAAGLRAWGVKALLADTLLRVEAARLGVADLSSPADWLARLEAAGELVVQMPTEVEMRAYYLANIHRFRLSEARRVRHVLVGDRESAEHMRKLALDGAALAQLATDSSLDRGSRSRGGDLGWVERGHLTGPLEEAIFEADLNQVIGPVASGFGWHLVVVEAVRQSRTRSFHECREQIQVELAEHHRHRSWLTWLDQRTAEAVRVPEGVEHPLFRGLPGSPHRH